MNFKEFTRQLGKAGLNYKQFAELIKVTPSSISSIKIRETKKGEDVPKNIAIIASLLGEMAEKGIDYGEVFARIDIKPQKSRHTGRPIKKKQTP